MTETAQDKPKRWWQRIRWKKVRAWTAWIIAGLFALDAFMMISGNRVLIHEDLVQPGTNYLVPGYGNLKKNTQASLVCRYFTGRSFTNDVLWYSANNQLGRDQCPFIGREVALGEQATSSSSPNWITIAAFFLSMLTYGTVEYHRRKEAKKKKQDSAYQIGYKLATLISEAMSTSKNLYPKGTTYEDWKEITDPYEIIRTLQPAVGFDWSMTRDLTDAEQNLLMSLREEEFLMDMTETYARNQSIREGILEYKSRYAGIVERMPDPDYSYGNVASYGMDNKLKLKLFQYVVPAGTLMVQLREMAKENIDMLRRMGSGFHEMMKKHYPDLHIHKIEEVTEEADSLAATAAVEKIPEAVDPRAAGWIKVTVSWD